MLIRYLKKLIKALVVLFLIFLILLNVFTWDLYLAIPSFILFFAFSMLLYLNALGTRLVKEEIKNNSSQEDKNLDTAKINVGISKKIQAINQNYQKNTKLGRWGVSKQAKSIKRMKDAAEEMKDTAKEQEISIKAHNKEKKEVKAAAEEEKTKKRDKLDKKQQVQEEQLTKKTAAKEKKQQLTHETLTFRKGATYTGGVKDGQPHGQGTYTEPKRNSTHIGEWKDGKKHGHGTYTIGGSTHIGEWKDGKEHGQGTLTYGDTIRTGEWINGQQTGQGTLIDGKQGIEYVGGFRKGSFHGRGSIKRPDGSITTCEWNKSSPRRPFHIKYPDGRTETL